MKRITLLAITVLAFGKIYSQASPAIELETWSDKPVLHTIDKKFNTESAVILLQTSRTEYVDDAKGNVLSYKTLHKIIHVNDDKGIEAFNKIYLPVSDNNDITDIKARTILPGGKVIELDKSNIKDLKEEDRQYKIFALDGLQKGCEVEYYYTYNKDVSFFGREVIQTHIPVLAAQLCIISPERLSFEIKTFNTNAKKTDTVLNGKRTLLVYMQDLPGAEEMIGPGKGGDLADEDGRLHLPFLQSRGPAEHLLPVGQDELGVDAPNEEGDADHRRHPDPAAGLARVTAPPKPLLS